MTPDPDSRAPADRGRGCAAFPGQRRSGQKTGASPNSSARSSRFRILPAAIPGQLLAAEPVAGGNVVGGQSLTHVTRELVGGDVHTRSEHDDRPHLLAQDRMGNADDGAVGHRRVLVERGLDLDAVDVLSSADDHVLRPVDDVDEPLLIDAGHVAGVEPAPGERGRRVLGLVPVPPDHVRALDPQLTGAVRVRRQVGGLLARPVLGDHGHIAHR